MPIVGIFRDVLVLSEELISGPFTLILGETSMVGTSACVRQLQEGIQQRQILVATVI